MLSHVHLHSYMHCKISIPCPWQLFISSHPNVLYSVRSKNCPTAIPEHAYCGHKFYFVLKMYKIETIYLNKTNLVGGREKACNVSRWIMHPNKDINEAKGYPPSSGLCEVRLDSRPLHTFFRFWITRRWKASERMRWFRNGIKAKMWKGMDESSA